MEAFIIGLGETGASISLAMNEAGASISCTGYDPDAQVAREARKRGDIDRIVFTPRKASQGADIIFMTISPEMVQEHIEIIGPTLKNGAVIVDMSPLKSAAMKWATESIREGCFYIGAVPVINPIYLEDESSGPSLPHADMFRDGLLALAIPSNTPENVVDLTYAISEILGASPFFIDPAEIDAITATVEHLPALMGIVQMQLGLQAPMWREIRRMAGRSWSKSAMIGTNYDPRDFTELIKLNRQNVIYKIDAVLEELGRLRLLLTGEDDEALSNYIHDANNAFFGWISDRKTGNLSGPELKRPTVPKLSVFEKFFGSRPPRRKP
jgi:prephenate dehydrogenase